MKFTSEQALQKLIAGNELYLKSPHNPGNTSSDIRIDTGRNGQNPYAVIMTCSDSRVPPEHIFSAGIGELFIVRTAGNVVGVFELETIEFGVLMLGAPLIVIMGHTQCGAVLAALDGDIINNITHEIRLGLNGEKDENPAVRNNILHSKNKILKSKPIQKLLSEGKVSVACALYDIKTGKVEFI